MPDPRRALGQLGEELAVHYLQQRGYDIVERNYRCPYGEVDVVARDSSRLAFVEVRARRGTAFGSPEESVTPQKQQRLVTVAREYLQAHDIVDVDWGIDVVAVEFTSTGVLRRIELLRDVVMEM
jgi:putative endonuclease